MLRILFCLLLPLCMIACSKPEKEEGLTIEYFRSSLQANMTYQHLLDAYGEPYADFGSGIHIYAWVLKDGTEVRIGYSDHILYAYHTQSNGTIIAVLI